MPHYIALIHKDLDSDYGVSFPDFPGLATAGRTLDEAREMAEEALAFHVEGMIEDGEALPEASTLDAVMGNPADHDGVVTLISLKPAAKRAVRVNVTLPEDVLAEIDRYAENRGLTRSGFLTHAAKRAMEDAE
jgi:predicted RNase H-like HicB family nuclease